MKAYGMMVGALLMMAFTARAQSLVGSWQLVDEKTCFEAQISESETEKELRQSMGSTRNAVARVISFRKNGSGEEGIFSTGKKKATDKTTFNYRVSGTALQLLDRKSGIMTQELVIDELTDTTLRFHLAGKACETKTLTRIK